MDTYTIDDEWDIIPSGYLSDPEYCNSSDSDDEGWYHLNYSSSTSIPPPATIKSSYSEVLLRPAARIPFPPHLCSLHQTSLTPRPVSHLNPSLSTPITPDAYETRKDKMATRRHYTERSKLRLDRIIFWWMDIPMNFGAEGVMIREETHKERQRRFAVERTHRTHPCPGCSRKWEKNRKGRKKNDIKWTMKEQRREWDR